MIARGGRIVMNCLHKKLCRRSIESFRELFLISTHINNMRAKLRAGEIVLGAGDFADRSDGDRGACP